MTRNDDGLDELDEVVDVVDVDEFDDDGIADDVVADVVRLVRDGNGPDGRGVCFRWLCQLLASSHDN